MRVEKMNERGLTAHVFGKRAGVTVRALHHYDRLGLLKPSGRTPAGYRLYQESDLARLEQIVALKFIGFSLRDIRKLLRRMDGPPGSRLQRDRRFAAEMLATLRLQRTVIEQKRRHMDRAVRAIQAAERALEAAPKRRRSYQPDWEMFRRIIEVIQMQNNKAEWAMKYYSDEAQTKLAERGKLWSPEKQKKWNDQWGVLIREVEEARDEDPAGERAGKLAERWMKLVWQFTGGDSEILTGLRKLYNDQANWPAEAREQMQPFKMSPEARAFINRAIEIGKRPAHPS